MSEINMNIDALLDGTLDDLADLPEFKPFPPGTHRCTLKMEIKKIDKNTAVEVGLTALGTEELADTSDTPLSPGDNTSVLYFLTHTNPKAAEIGQGGFKNLMKSLAEHFGAKSNRELMEEGNGAEVLVVTGYRLAKKDPQNPNADRKKYTDLLALQVV